jgi:hypothetical protein
MKPFHQHSAALVIAGQKMRIDQLRLGFGNCLGDDPRVFAVQRGKSVSPCWVTARWLWNENLSSWFYLLSLLCTRRQVRACSPISERSSTSGNDLHAHARNSSSVASG